MKPAVSDPLSGLSSGPAIDFSQKNFLVIDDFQGMRGMLRDILRGCGAKVVDMAGHGAEAVSMLEKRKYDVVLCDFDLGAGKNGQQILEEAKVRHLVGPACAWVMVSAEKTADMVIGAAEYQPDAYLIKPITEAILRSRLERIWGRKEAFRDIDRAMAAKDYLKAIRLCDARLETDRANASELLRVKCQLLVESGEVEQAKALCESILAQREVPWARVGLGRALLQAGDHAAAKAALQKAVEDNRSYLEAYDWLAKALQASGEHDKAEEVLERAVKLSPNSVTRQKSLGDVALSLGKLDSAEKAFRKSVTLGEHSVLRSPDTYLGLAKTCSAKANPDEALRVIASLGKTFDSEEVRLKAVAAEGMVHHQNGDPLKARKAAQELGRLLAEGGAKPDSGTAMDMAKLMLATGEKEAAVALLQEEVKNNPENPGLLDQVRQVFTQANMGEEGAVLVESSRQEAIDLMNHGVLLAKDGKLAEAVEWLRDAREKMPMNVRMLFNFAHVAISHLKQAGPNPELADEAHDCLLRANRLAPGDKRFAQLVQLLAPFKD